MFAFILTERKDGCDVTTNVKKSEIEALLASYDFPTEDIPEMIVQINLGQEINCRNRAGIVCDVWYDPKTDELCCKQYNPYLNVSNRIHHLCPNCGADPATLGGGPAAATVPAVQPDGHAPERFRRKGRSWR